MRMRLVRAVSLSLLVGSLGALPILPVSADHPGGGGRPFSTTLIGAAERPGPGAPPPAIGSAELRLNPGQEEVCFELTVSGLTELGQTVSGAHIHRAGPNEPGPIVVPLTPPTTGASSGCVHADRALIKAIMKNPENYYVNVHAVPSFGPGALRGQLSK